MAAMLLRFGGILAVIVLGYCMHLMKALKKPLHYVLVLVKIYVSLSDDFADYLYQLLLGTDIRYERKRDFYVFKKFFSIRIPLRLISMCVCLHN